MQNERLEFTAEMGHHEYDNAKITIDECNHAASPVVDIDIGGSRVSMTIEEIRELSGICDLYERAKKIFEECG